MTLTKNIGRILLGIIFLTWVSGVHAQTWTFTGSMSTSRGHYIAVLLHTGKVLVAGGANAQGALSSAELYDPGTGTWSATGSMTTPRFYHAAALLTDGRVLVTGGFNTIVSPKEPLNSAELYDPTSGTWTLTNSMTVPRRSHTVTTLVNGQVLAVAGIIEESPATSTGIVERYDPNTGLFLSTNPITGTTSDHNATLLSDGRVLVTGGRGFGPFEAGQLSSAQVYDSTSGMWTLVGRMIVPREGHTATRLQNGRVLIAGGDTTNEISVTSAELFNPTTNTFSLTGSMHQARNEQGVALLLSGQVLVAGGSGNPNIPRLASAELYNPLDGMWTNTSSMQTPRDNYTAIVLPSGKVLAAGGVSGNIDPPTLEASAELYELGAIIVIIDIKPGSSPNSINLSAAGVIPVAIFSSSSFDAPAEIDPESLTLAGARVKVAGKSDKSLCHSEDVNHDGRLDLVCQFENDLNAQVGNTTATLEGNTFTGIPIRGQDSINIVPD